MPMNLFSFGTRITGVTKGLMTAMGAIQSLALVGHHLGSESLLGEAASVLPSVDVPLSANQIIRSVRLMGFHVGRQAALNVIRQVKAQVTNRVYIASLSPSKLPLAKNIAFSPFNITSKYQYFVEVIGTNFATGERNSQWITVAADRLISKKEAESLAIGAIVGGERYKIDDIESVRIDNILKAPKLV